MSTLSTHVLDAVAGLPADGMDVVLDWHHDGEWERIGGGRTDADGRVTDPAPDGLGIGVYRLVFDTGAWFRRMDRDGFFPEVSVVFRVVELDRHHHVPLLLSSYAYSTYRGS